MGVRHDLSDSPTPTRRTTPPPTATTAGTTERANIRLVGSQLGSAARLGDSPEAVAAASCVARNRRLGREGAPDGLPIPPAHLIYSIATTRDERWLLTGWERAGRSIREVLVGIGRPIESLPSVLDFGCGCGRVVRYWRGMPGLAVHGSDYNPAGIAWVREHLPFVDARVNRLERPLPFADGAFDFCYALSVFTHLPVEMHRP